MLNAISFFMHIALFHAWKKAPHCSMDAAIHSFRKVDAEAFRLTPNPEIG